MPPFKCDPERLSLLVKGLRVWIDTGHCFFLSRYVGALRVNYLLRTSSVSTQVSSMHDIDGIVRNTLEICVNVDTSDAAWEQGTLQSESLN